MLVEELELSTELINVIDAEQAWKYYIVPFQEEKGVYHFYIDEECSIESTQMELEMILGSAVQLHAYPKSVIQPYLSKYYRRQRTGSQSVTQFKLKSHNDDFLAQLIREAKQIGSSDIHFEAYEDKARIRFRIDGQLIEKYIIEKADYPGFVNKVKIQSNLDISEKRLPQDGRIHYEAFGEKFDIRVSILPTLHGEKMVLRILSNDATNVVITKVGMNDKDLKSYMEGVKKPHGILLISGPTGSGKTTTLYATLKELNKVTKNIITIEDPIEYTLEGINQVQLKEGIGLGFSEALRSFLRQDPDVIMLGEIRDAETAQMAIRAALTGHLVLSTIHTNSAWGTISRLIDMGVPPFLLSSTLNTSVAQRLVRTLCPHCKEETNFTNTMLPAGFEIPSAIETIHSPVGCDECYYTGYKGRKALFEVIPIDNDLALDIKDGLIDIQDKLKEKKIQSLAMNAFELLKDGSTSVEEVYPILMNQ